MAIDFIRNPPPDLQTLKPKVDFYKPEPVNLEAKYEEDKAKLDADKAAFEIEKNKDLKVLEEEKKETPKNKPFIRKAKVITDEPLRDSK